MFLILSHLIAFLALSVGAIFDLKTTEVPDYVSVIPIISGIALHFIASFNTGLNFSRLLDLNLVFNQTFGWFQALGEPLLWSLGVGAVFSVIGWSMYFTGMWGGADAFAMSVLGFAAPSSVSGFNILHPVNMFINMLILGLFYTLGFALYKSLGSGAFKKTYKEIKEQELRISVEIVLAATISALGGFYGTVNPFTYFTFFLVLIFLYRYLKLVQDDMMKHEVPVSELEGGEVLAKGELEDDKIRGIKEEEIEDIEKDSVEVREGIRFVPVFPIALLVTDVFGGGLTLFMFVFSL